MREGTTASDNNIQKESIIHMALRGRGGMPKKGVKKQTKAEKMVPMRARLAYVSQSLAQQSLALVNQVADASYIPTAISQMNAQQLQNLEGCVQNATRTDRIPGSIAELVVPLLGQYTAQRTDLDKAISALTQAVEVSFNEAYFDKGLDMQGFWEAIEARKNVLDQEERDRQQANMNTAVEQEVQRRLAAMGADGAMRD